MSHSKVSHQKQRRSFLYQVVFDVVLIKWLIAFVFTFFLLHPVVPVFAAEDSVTAETELPEPEVQSEPEREAEVEKVVEEKEEVIEAETGNAEEETDSTDETVVSPETENETSEVTEQTTEEQPVESETVDAGGNTSHEINDTDQEIESKATSSGTDIAIPAGDTSTSSSSTSSDSVVVPIGGGSSAESASSSSQATTTVDTVTSTSTEILDETVQPAEEAPPEVITTGEAPDVEESEEVNDSPDDTATSTENEAEKIVYVTIEATNDLNRHTFGVNECVSVGDGAYYCSKAGDNTIAEADGVYEKVDSEGDYEIYLRDNGHVIQITNNSYDDRAPEYDSQAESIVWHRLVGDRYQIMRYDLDKETEEQLTNERTNHMEPAQAGGVTVWQQWENGNWEIYGLIDDEFVRLSDSSFHDVAPTVRDGYVMWHTTGMAGEKLLSVYEISTGVASTINDPDGGQVSNPRFVLVYDTTAENGDVITKTFNPETGEVSPVGSDPAPIPKLPDPEPTGETTAIINTKTSTRSESNDDIDDLLSGSDPNDNFVPETGTTTAGSASSTQDVDAGLDLDLSASSTDVLPLSDFDLIVEPFTSTSTQSSDSATTSADVE